MHARVIGEIVKAIESREYAEEITRPAKEELIKRSLINFMSMQERIYGWNLFNEISRRVYEGHSIGDSSLNSVSSRKSDSRNGFFGSIDMQSPPS